MQLETVLLGSGNLRINNGLLLKYSSELCSETRMLANMMLCAQEVINISLEV